MKKLLKRIYHFILDSNVLEVARFEYRSKVCRIFSRKLVIDRNKNNYINLGCGIVYSDNFINVDFYNNSKADYKMDLRFPFKIDSNSIDGIFSEHTFEHLTYDEVHRSLSECYRILKPGGAIRIILPDLSLFVRNYAANNNEWFKKWEDLTLKDVPSRSGMKLFSNLFALSFITQNYGHRSSWDYQTLTYFLDNRGFKNIKEMKFMEGTKELLLDLNSDDRKYISLYVEATK